MFQPAIVTSTPESAVLTWIYISYPAELVEEYA